MIDLIERWRLEAAHLRPYVPPAAEAWDRAADELEAHLRALDNETVNLRQAAQLSGYSEDYLGQQVREGRIPNAGRKNAPRIRLADLPRKAGCGDGAGAVTVLGLAARRELGLEEGEGGGRVRAPGRGDAQGRVPASLSPVGG